MDHPVPTRPRCKIIKQDRIYYIMSGGQETEWTHKSCVKASSVYWKDDVMKQGGGLCAQPRAGKRHLSLSGY